MNGHRAIAGFSLLCVLVLCAFAASSASAAGTTAFTCTSAEPGTGGFADAHCDRNEAGGTFVHKAIEAAETEIEITNKETRSSTTEAVPFRLAGEIVGVSVEVECKIVNGTGKLTNASEGGVMHAAGEVTFKLSECIVPKPSGCQVTEPITYTGKFKTYQSGEEMGVEFVPMGGGNNVFAEITFTGSSCLVKGIDKVEGSFEGTPAGTSSGKGATLWFTESMGHLKWGGYPYKVLGALVWKMKAAGDPIVFTTT